MHVPPPSQRYREKHQHQPSAPQEDQLPEFIRAGVELAVMAAAGRIGLRLRLSPLSHNEGQPILLGLSRGLYTQRSDDQ